MKLENRIIKNKTCISSSEDINCEFARKWLKKAKQKITCMFLEITY